MLTLTFNFKVKLGINRCRNWVLFNIFFVIGGGGGREYFLINKCSDRTLLTVWNMLTLTFIFKVK